MAARRSSILIVGPSDATRERFARIAAGIAGDNGVAVANNTMPPYAAARQAPPDILVYLGGTPLEEFVRAARSLPGWEGLPILFAARDPLTGDALEEAVRCGADDVISADADDAMIAHRMNLLLRMDAINKQLRTARDRVRDMVGQQASLLRDSEEQFQATVRSSGQAVAVVEGDGTVRFISPSMEALLGWSDDEVKGHHLSAVMHPADLPLLTDSWNTLLSDEMSTISLETRVKTKRGEWRWFRVVASNQMRVPGIHGIVLNCEDIQERRRMAEALRASQTRYRRLLETTQEGIWTTDECDRTTFVNDRLAAMLGYARHEMLGKKPEAFMQAEDVEPYKRRMEKRVAGAVENYEHRFVRSDGSIMWARIAASPIYDDDGTYVGSFGMVQDITEEKRNRAALEDAVARVTTLIENAPLVAVQGYTRDGTVVLWNRACTALYGYERDEVLGRRLQDFLIRPEDRGRFEETLERIWQNGEPTPVEYWEVTTRSGETRHVMSTMVPVRTSGETTCVYGMDVDITERILTERELEGSRRELEALNSRLGQLVQERTAAMREAIEDLDSFAFSITHDLKAPLRAINGFSTALVEEVGDLLEGTPREYLKFIVENVSLMNTLIEELLAFSRCGRQSINWRQLEMESLVQAALRMQDHTLVKRAELIIESLPRCYGDAVLITQVLSNLLSNALKYSRTRPNPRVEVFSLGIASGMVTYAVRDNGVGFDPDYAERLFNVFQRFHSAEQFEGVGVGLAIVKRIIKRHGGEVSAQSKVDEGATFTFTLPHERPESPPTEALSDSASV